jgi:hypothetical protein
MFSIGKLEDRADHNNFRRVLGMSMGYMAATSLVTCNSLYILGCYKRAHCLHGSEQITRMIPKRGPQDGGEKVSSAIFRSSLNED